MSVELGVSALPVASGTFAAFLSLVDSLVPNDRA